MAHLCLHTAGTAVKDADHTSSRSAALCSEKSPSIGQYSSASQRNNARHHEQRNVFTISVALKTLRNQTNPAQYGEQRTASGSTEGEPRPFLVTTACTNLEQFIPARHFCTSNACLPVTSKNSPLYYFLSWSLTM